MRTQGRSGRGGSSGRTVFPGAGSGSRIRGIDVARAVAIFGMFAVHIGPTDADGFWGWLYSLPHGRASILFLLVAGVGVSLLARSRTTSGREARLSLGWRALLLLPLGLVLQLGDHRVFVILQEYAVLFVLGALVLGLGDRWLLALAATSALAGPVAYLWGRINVPDAFDRSAVVWGDPAGEIAHGLLLSGPYPLIVWAAPFLLGVWVGRRDLRSARVRGWLMAAGGSGAVLAWLVSTALGAVTGGPSSPVGWDGLTTSEPHSQMPLWLLGSTGSAALVLGGALMVGERFRRTLWPLAAAGQLALTIYVAHVVALHFAHATLTAERVGPAALRLAAFALAGVVFATAWRALFERGPLETLLRLPRRSPDRSPGSGRPAG